MLDFDIWTILFSVINILVLFFFLKKFLFGRVNKILEERAKLVQDDLDNAKAKSEQAQALKEEYESTLTGAKEEAKQIVSDAKIRAQESGDAITAQAQRQAEAMLEDAQKEIELERQRTLEGVQGEIADLALAAASKLMEQKLGDETNRELVNAFLSEEGAEQ